MELEIKELTKDNLDKIIALDQICFGGLWTKGAYEREIDSPRSLLLGIFQVDPSPLHQELIGMSCFWAIVEEAHITLLGIDPNYRGQGLGELLLSHLLLQAHQWSLERATLEVRASNTTAINLYQKLGFEIAGRRKDYYPLPPEDALILWRSRLQEPEFSQEMKNIQEKRCAALLTKGWDILQSS
ncbi:ribosomal-protein-alanine N-acetyltransferase [Euhalothece natronophila Z-M001]|uniref:Ribosomal-protein-alanine N-acetyltransferase n=1 Tax=Euhalothece natronophila Z-M001 TaxID=522448 RepID=A0A5B8NLG2_9CHRO|nr:ribosomal protein S18-alanine N-acetyltransferase [Euhalothece natronophila]QDZ39856.1 ribosomal-protein-alanine N-acetyltransferase [Euhalothece natronophila Z-M001]